MPLKPGRSEKVIKRNHDNLVSEGRPDDQAWAIAYDFAREYGYVPPPERKKPTRGSRRYWTIGEPACRSGW